MLKSLPSQGFRRSMYMSIPSAVRLELGTEKASTATPSKNMVKVLPVRVQAMWWNSLVPTGCGGVLW